MQIIHDDRVNLYSFNKVPSKHLNPFLGLNNPGEYGKNGEQELFRLISPLLQTVFDVGCRTDIVYYMPNIHLHLFEPNPDSFALLNIKVQSLKASNIFANNFGLGNEVSQRIYYRKWESFVKRSCGRMYGGNPATLDIKKLDDYCEENNITKIDFLKIDTEGYELDVLRGGTNIVYNTQFIQFEYGGAQVDHGITLSSMYEFLDNHGFDFIFIIGPGQLVLQNTPYEHGEYSNYFACRSLEVIKGCENV